MIMEEFSKHAREVLFRVFSHTESWTPKEIWDTFENQRNIGPVSLTWDL